MSTEIYALLIIAVIAVALLIFDRYFRINPFLGVEGFLSGGDHQRCGTDLEPCPHPQKCMNSFCSETTIAQLRDRNPLPVTP